jgi:hypothetical protein
VDNILWQLFISIAFFASTMTLGTLVYLMIGLTLEIIGVIVNPKP